jgi:hypothetical protein
MINFPATAGQPTDGSFTHTHNGQTWYWDGTTWLGSPMGSAGTAYVKKTGDTMSGPLAMPLGTAAAPSLTVSGNTNTGLFSPAADQLAVSVGGTGKLTTGSWGTTLSSGAHFVASDDTATGAFVTQTSGGQVRIALLKDGQARFQKDVLIGGTLPSAPAINLAANGNITALNLISAFLDTARSGTGWWAKSVYLFLFVDQNNNPAFQINTAASNELILYGSSAIKVGGGSWSATSDVRVKQNVEDYTSGLEQILALRPVSYEYITSPGSYVGLIAQEAEEVMPELVTHKEGTLPDGTKVADLRTLDQTALTFALINAVKELSAKVAALEAV